MPDAKTVSRETAHEQPRERRDCQYPAVPAGACPVCLGTLPCGCAQAYADPVTLGTPVWQPGAPSLLGSVADSNALAEHSPAVVQDARTLPAFAKLGAPKPTDVQALIASYARGPIALRKGGALVAFEPFDRASDTEPCAVCEGRGGELEHDEDGPHIGKWCRCCGGTGERAFCGECLDALPFGEDPRDEHAATHVLTVRTDMGPVTRLCCEDAEHLGAALQDVVGAARRMQEQHERAQADASRLQAAIEADASKEPL